MAEYSCPTPFVLLGRKKLPPEEPPSPEDIYDGNRQLWVDKASGVPLVSRMQGHAEHSQYGETTITETREGADQTEGVTISASRFGETTITKTREGADQTEGAAGLRASQYGETVHTRTREGLDQTESTAFSGSPYGETTMKNTREGVDQ